MLGSVSRQLRPRFSRGVSQVLADPMAWNQAPVVVSTLPNGVRVASQDAYSQVSSVGIFVDAGVRNETQEIFGANHFIEQLARTGTATKSQAQFEKAVESIGATLSVNCGREQSSFTMSVLKQDVGEGLNILTDLVTRPATGNLEREKSNIIRNLEEQDKPTRAVIDDRLHHVAFRDCSLGFSTIGPFEGIEGFTEAQLKKFLDANYTAERMVVVGAGVDHSELVALANAQLGGLNAGVPRAFENKPYFCGADLVYRNDEMGPTAYVSIAFQGVPWRSPEAVTFMLMQAIIGNYTKGKGVVPGTISGNRTHNAVANKMGVGCAEKFTTFNLNYKDTGLFGFYAECDEVAVEHCVGELMFGINLLSFAVTDEEVERAKRDMKVALFSESGSTASDCAKIGKQMLAYGRGVSNAEMILRIDAIDAEEVKRVAYEYINDTEVAVTALGPLHGLPNYLDIRRQSVMHRY